MLPLPVLLLTPRAAALRAGTARGGRPMGCVSTEEVEVAGRAEEEVGPSMWGPVVLAACGCELLLPPSAALGGPARESRTGRAGGAEDRPAML